MISDNQEQIQTIRRVVEEVAKYKESFNETSKYMVHNIIVYFKNTLSKLMIVCTKFNETSEDHVKCYIKLTLIIISINVLYGEAGGFA